MAESRPYRDWTKSQRAQNTRASQVRNGPEPVPVRTVVRRPSAWRNLKEVTVRVERLDAATTTFDLWKQFSQEGEVVFIELYETTHGTRNGSGKVRFSPPPKEEFWAENEGRYRLSRKDNTQYLALTKLETPKQEALIQSPVRKHKFYPPRMKLVPYRLDFGIMEKEQTFTSLRKAITKQSSDLSFTIDLKRKSIVVKFAHSFVDPRSQGVNDFRSYNEIGKLDRDNHYMFHIPFGQLHTIKHLDYDKFGIQDFFGLVIKLENPPSFYRKQLGMNAGHTDESLSWSEFDTWYRQTDIDYDPYRLQKAKVSLHKIQPEIDIGIVKYSNFFLHMLTTPRTLDNLFVHFSKVRHKCRTL